MKTLKGMPAQKREEDSLEGLRRAPTCYQVEREDFISYLETEGLKIGREGIERYLSDCEQRTHRDREGRKVGYSVSWYNQRIKAIKETVRYALDHTDMTNGDRYAVERYLRGLKTRKPKTGISKAERVPTGEEVRTLIDAADPRLALMIRFLVETACRISEMIGAEIGNARRGARLTHIEIIGKGQKARDLRLRSSLYDAIREEFKGARYLFEHGGRQYSRVSVTARIKIVAERTIGKAVSAHMLRHYRGTRLSEELGISKAADVLGHADIRTTKIFYDDSRVTDEEFERTLDKDGRE